MEWVTMPFSRGSFCPCIKLRSRALQAYSLTSEPPGSPWLLRHALLRHPSQTNISQVYDTDASKRLDKKSDCTCSWSSPLRKKAIGNPDNWHFKWPHFSVCIPKFLLLYLKLISKEWTCKVLSTNLYSLQQRQGYRCTLSLYLWPHRAAIEPAVPPWPVNNKPCFFKVPWWLLLRYVLQL